MTECECYYCKNNLLWPEEEEALERIMSGKEKLTRCTADELIKQLNEWSK
jgi:hypothetical protein